MDCPEDGDLPDHFYLAPSSSHRWIPCPGSQRVKCRDEPGEAALLGTLAHSMVFAKLTAKPLSDDDQRYFDSLSLYLQNSLTDAVDSAVDFVKRLPHPIKRYELKIQSDIIEEHGGTVDCAAVSPDEIHVVDYKFGRLAVEVDKNPQIACYINLVRQLYPGRKRFFGTVVQPFNGGVSDKTEFTPEFLEATMLGVIKASISSELNAGDHCQFCHLLPSCIVAAKHVHDQVKGVDLTQIVGDANGKPTEAQVAKLAKLYRVHKLAEKASEGAAEILKSWFRRGVDIASHGLGIRTTNRVVWQDDAEETLKRLNLKPEDFTRQTMLTPNQVAQQLGMSNDAFRQDFKAAIGYKEIDNLVAGKGGKTDFSEFH